MPAVPWRSALPVEQLAGAAVAAQLLAARRLEHDKLHPLLLDGSHIAAAFTSERHYRRLGENGSIGFAPLSGFHRTRDGWIRLHANYPHHERVVQDVLGADPPARLLEATALEAEEAVVAAGGVAAAVRSRAEWSVHPQGRAVAQLPALSVTPVLEAPPRRAALAGLRVLDVTRVIAGPVCTRTLASHGADVVRVDSPELPEDLDTLLETGSGKSRMRLDLGSAGDRRRFEGLLVQADVLVTGYRPGSLDRFGLAPAALGERHPHLVQASVSAWGAAGPWAERRGFDSIVQAATGIAARLADGDGTPGVLPAQVLDHAAGHLLAAAVMSGLRSRRDGGVWQAAVSLAQLAELLQRSAGATASGTGEPAAAADPPLLRLDTSYGAVEVVAPVSSPPWTRGLVECKPASSWPRDCCRTG